MKNRPAYAIDSVDHALHLATLLQQEGPLRIIDAAERLGVSRSTAHRLLSMLVYRDFAEQDPDRRYRAGPVLRPAPHSEAPVALLRRVARPHMENLVALVGESVNLMVRAGTETRFIATVETDHVLRVGDRTGRSLPAHLTSGGKAILAALPPADLTALYADDPAVDLPRLRRELSIVRKRGVAINDQATEAGLTALGRVITDDTGAPFAAVSIALPTARFSRSRLPTWIAALTRTAKAIEAALTTQR